MAGRPPKPATPTDVNVRMSDDGLLSTRTPPGPGPRSSSPGTLERHADPTTNPGPRDASNAGLHDAKSAALRDGGDGGNLAAISAQLQRDRALGLGAILGPAYPPSVVRGQVGPGNAGAGTESPRRGGVTARPPSPNSQRLDSPRRRMVAASSGAVVADGSSGGVGGPETWGTFAVVDDLLGFPRLPSARNPGASAGGYKDQGSTGAHASPFFPPLTGDRPQTPPGRPISPWRPVRGAGHASIHSMDPAMWAAVTAMAPLPSPPMGALASAATGPGGGAAASVPPVPPHQAEENQILEEWVLRMANAVAASTPTHGPSHHHHHSHRHSSLSLPPNQSAQQLARNSLQPDRAALASVQEQAAGVTPQPLHLGAHPDTTPGYSRSSSVSLPLSRSLSTPHPETRTSIGSSTDASNRHHHGASSQMSPPNLALDRERLTAMGVEPQAVNRLYRGLFMQGHAVRDLLQDMGAHARDPQGALQAVGGAYVALVDCIVRDVVSGEGKLPFSGRGERDGADGGISGGGGGDGDMIPVGSKLQYLTEELNMVLEAKGAWDLKCHRLQKLAESERAAVAQRDVTIAELQGVIQGLRNNMAASEAEFQRERIASKNKVAKLEAQLDTYLMDADSARQQVVEERREKMETQQKLHELVSSLRKAEAKETSLNSALAEKVNEITSLKALVEATSSNLRNSEAEFASKLMEHKARIDEMASSWSAFRDVQEEREALKKLFEEEAERAARFMVAKDEMAAELSGVRDQLAKMTQKFTHCDGERKRYQEDSYILRKEMERLPVLTKELSDAKGLIHRLMAEVAAKRMLAERAEFGHELTSATARATISVQAKSIYDLRDMQSHLCEELQLVRDQLASSQDAVDVLQDTLKTFKKEIRAMSEKSAADMETILTLTGERDNLRTELDSRGRQLVRAKESEGAMRAETDAMTTRMHGMLAHAESMTMKLKYKEEEFSARLAEAAAREMEQEQTIGKLNETIAVLEVETLELHKTRVKLARAQDQLEKALAGQGEQEQKAAQLEADAIAKEETIAGLRAELLDITGTLALKEALVRELQALNTQAVVDSTSRDQQCQYFKDLIARLENDIVNLKNHVEDLEATQADLEQQLGRVRGIEDGQRLAMEALREESEEKSRQLEFVICEHENKDRENQALLRQAQIDYNLLVQTEQELRQTRDAAVASNKELSVSLKAMWQRCCTEADAKMMVQSELEHMQEDLEEALQVLVKQSGGRKGATRALMDFKQSQGGSDQGMAELEARFAAAISGKQRSVSKEKKGRAVDFGPDSILGPPPFDDLNSTGAGGAAPGAGGLYSSPSEKFLAMLPPVGGMAAGSPMLTRQSSGISRGVAAGGFGHYWDGSPAGSNPGSSAAGDYGHGGAGGGGGGYSDEAPVSLFIMVVPPPAVSGGVCDCSKNGGDNKGSASGEGTDGGKGGELDDAHKAALRRDKQIFEQGRREGKLEVLRRNARAHAREDHRLSLSLGSGPIGGLLAGEEGPHRERRSSTGSALAAVGRGAIRPGPLRVPRPSGMMVASTGVGDEPVDGPDIWRPQNSPATLAVQVGDRSALGQSPLASSLLVSPRAREAAPMGGAPGSPRGASAVAAAVDGDSGSLDTMVPPQPTTNYRAPDGMPTAAELPLYKKSLRTMVMRRLSDKKEETDKRMEELRRREYEDREAAAASIEADLRKQRDGPTPSSAQLELAKRLQQQVELSRRLHADIEAVRGENADCQRKIALLNHRLREAREERDLLTAQNQSVAADLEGARATIAQLREDIEGLKKEMAERRAKVASHSKLQEKFMEQTGRKLRAAEQQLTTLKAERRFINQGVQTDNKFFTYGVLVGGGAPVAIAAAGGPAAVAGKRGQAGGTSVGVPTLNLEATKRANLLLSLKNTMRIVTDIYAMKVKNDVYCMRQGQPAVPLPMCIKRYFLQRYGTDEVADASMVQFVSSLSAHQSNPEVRIFAQSCGLSDDTGLWGEDNGPTDTVAAGLATIHSPPFTGESLEPDESGAATENMFQHVDAVQAGWLLRSARANKNNHNDNNNQDTNDPPRQGAGNPMVPGVVRSSHLLGATHEMLSQPLAQVTFFRPKRGVDGNPHTRVLPPPMPDRDDQTGVSGTLAALLTHPVVAGKTEQLEKESGMVALLAWMRREGGLADMTGVDLGVPVGPHQLPQLHAIMVQACQMLGMARAPPLYISDGLLPRAYVWLLQSGDPALVLQSSAVDVLDPEEIQSLLACQLVRLLVPAWAPFVALSSIAEHHPELLAAAAEELEGAAPGWVSAWGKKGPPAPGGGGGSLQDGKGGGNAAAGAPGAVVQRPGTLPMIMSSLDRWSRFVDLCGDRASLVVTQDVEVVVSSIVKAAVGTPLLASQLDVAAVLRQARDSNAVASEMLAELVADGTAQVNSASILTTPRNGGGIPSLNLAAASSSLPVLRAREALRFANSPELHRILTGVKDGSVRVPIAGLEDLGDVAHVPSGNTERSQNGGTTRVFEHVPRLQLGQAMNPGSTLGRQAPATQRDSLSDTKASSKVARGSKTMR
eukprot:jgi/Mesvir1/27310/Mv07138-RA.1